MVVRQLLITPTVEFCIQQLGRVEEMVWLPYDAIQRLLLLYYLCNIVLTVLRYCIILVRGTLSFYDCWSQVYTVTSCPPTSLAYLHWVGIALHPWPFVSDIAIFLLKGDVILQPTPTSLNCSLWTGWLHNVSGFIGLVIDVVVFSTLLFVFLLLSGCCRMLQIMSAVLCYSVALLRNTDIHGTLSFCDCRSQVLTLTSCPIWAAEL